MRTLNKEGIGRKYLICFVVILMLAVTGCGKKWEQHGRIMSVGGTGESAADSMDYSQYVNKTWIVDGWNELTDSEWDLAVSMIITRIEDGHIEGYFKKGMILDDYCSFFMRDLIEFHGNVFMERAECLYGDEKIHSFDIVFHGGDRISMDFSGDGGESYLLRAYNVSDMEFTAEPETFEIDLDSWGIVTLIYAYRKEFFGGEDYRLEPCVLLVDEQKDILYKFFTTFLPKEYEVLKVWTGDLDGDGLKDVKVAAISFDVCDSSRIELYFFQREDGLFDKSVVIDIDDQRGYTMKSFQKDLWISFGEGSYMWRRSYEKKE